MRWYVFAIFAYLILVLDIGLRTLVTIGSVWPSLTLVLALFIGIWAPWRIAAWASLSLGCLVDLTSPLPFTGNEKAIVVVGPVAVGYLVAVISAVRMRTMIYRQSPTSLAVLVMVCGIAGQMVTVGLLTARGLPWLLDERIPGWVVADEIVVRFLRLVYTAVVSVPLGIILFKTKAWWGFVQLPGTARA